MRVTSDKALAELGIQIQVNMEVGGTDTIVEILEHGHALPPLLDDLLSNLLKHHPRSDGGE